MFTDKKMGFSTTEQVSQQQHLELDHLLGYCIALLPIDSQIKWAERVLKQMKERHSVLNSVVGKKDSPEKLSERVVEFTEQRAPNPAFRVPRGSLIGKRVHEKPNYESMLVPI